MLFERCLFITLGMETGKYSIFSKSQNDIGSGNIWLRESIARSPAKSYFWSMTVAWDLKYWTERYCI